MKNLTALADDKLVEMYVEGSNEAFDTLLYRYKDKLFSYIMYAVRDEDLANDIFQETFMKVIVSMRGGRYTGNDKFYPWIARIAHNLVMDVYRGEQVQNAANDAELMEHFYGDTVTFGNVREMEHEAADSLGRICGLLEYLPEVQQDVIRKRFYRGMSFKDIAEEEGISINTALGRVRYALINLRRLAGEHHLQPCIL